MIDEFDCDGCGKCMGVCEVEAIIKTSGKVPKHSEPINESRKI